jgi:hypothetical protein
MKVEARDLRLRRLRNWLDNASVAGSAPCRVHALSLPQAETDQPLIFATSILFLRPDRMLTLVVILFILIRPQPLSPPSGYLFLIDRPRRDIVATLFTFGQIGFIECRIGKTFVVSLSPLGFGRSALVFRIVD